LSEVEFSRPCRSKSPLNPHHRRGNRGRRAISLFDPQRPRRPPRWLGVWSFGLIGEISDNWIGGTMRVELLTLAAAAAATTLIAAQAPTADKTRPQPAVRAEPPDSHKWAPPRTPWGDPDLQGTYTTDNSIGVPFERPQQFAGRTELTDQEYA